MCITDKKCRMPVIAIFIAAFVIAVLLCGYSGYRIKGRIAEHFLDEYKESLQSFNYKLEGGAVYRDGHAVITGWMTDTGHIDSGYNYGVDTVLYGVYNNMHCGIVNGDKVIIFPTKLKKRPDVNNEINDGIDYKYCGFTAYIPSEYVSEYSDNEIVLTVKRRNGEEFIINMGITLKESMG